MHYRMCAKICEAWSAKYSERYMTSKLIKVRSSRASSAVVATPPTPPVGSVEASVQVTAHCIDQFILRTGRKKSKKCSEEVRDKILEMLELATQVILKPQYRSNQVIRNEFRGLGTYKKFNDWVFVLDENETTVLTVYKASNLRWAVK